MSTTQRRNLRLSLSNKFPVHIEEETKTEETKTKLDSCTKYWFMGSPIEQKVGANGRISTLSPSDVPDAPIKKVFKNPVNKALLKMLKDEGTIEISEKEISSLYIDDLGRSHNINVPDDMWFTNIEKLPGRIYRLTVKRQFPPLTDIFENKEILDDICKYKLELLQYEGDLPPWFSAGAQGSLYELPAPSMPGHWLIKIRKRERFPILLVYQKYDDAVETAIAMRTAEKCGNVNRVVGIVWFPKIAASSENSSSMSWGVVLWKIPRAQNFQDYLRKLESKETETKERQRLREDVEKKLWEQTDVLANCLYNEGITIDTDGTNNIITDDTGLPWVVDIDFIHKPKERDSYLANVRKYVSKLLP